MANILSDVATAAQEQAHKERGKELQPQENRIFQAAAAAELMMFTDPVLFEEMRKSGRRHDDDGWNEISQRKGYREPNSAWMRQLRAGIWIGGQTDRSVREKVRILLAAFESVIHDYLDVEDHRSELRAFAARHLESLTPLPTTPISSAPLEQEQQHVFTGVRTWRFGRRFSRTTLVVSVTIALVLIASGIAWWRVANSPASHAVNSPTSPPQTWSASRNGPVADPSIDPNTYQGGWGPDRPINTESTFNTYPVFDSTVDNPNVGDERNFVGIRTLNSDHVWYDRLRVKPGEIYWMRVYVRNDGTSNGGEDPTAWIQGARLYIAKSSPTRYDQVVWAELSAFNCKSVWDSASFASDVPISVAFDVSSLALENNAHSGQSGGMKVDQDAFTSNGTPIGYDKMDGVIKNGYQYDAYYSVKVVISAG